ncbi:MAG: deoxyribodipyrimidine photolyase [Flavobacteriaceae bacterium]|nr:deoxyribodipyrimidine photolyase [Flavobacteriaceae bacterium]|tara:strand:- start:1100 stop:2419 length:1320 start_codon:yes stop_codon:yes gene_type:complete
MSKEKEHSTALVWFRNDLRTTDQHSLYQAVNNHSRVIGVYCFDPRQFQKDRFGFPKTGAFRAAFLRETVQQLQQALKQLNIPLFISNEAPEEAIPSLVSEYNITSIYAQKEWTQEEQAVMHSLQKSTENHSVTFNTVYDQFLYHPEDLSFSIHSVPKVFTDFRKKIEKKIGIRNTVSVNFMPSENYFDTHTSLPSWQQLDLEPPEPHPDSAFPFSGGEQAAQNRLEHYLFETHLLSTYKQTRNGLIGTAYSSKFSPWLANGSLSPRTIFEAVQRYEKEVEKNQDTYWLIFELIWRDFFKYISLKHGNEIFKRKGILNKDYEWDTDWELINRWIAGETESDFVNANMIEFQKTGWMSNRGRQNVASYFAKELHQDWRIGAAYFESQLLDYDVHSNYGNWMYVAGVGNDPRNRKFDVEKQAERYDEDGAFRDLWFSEKAPL